MIMNGYEWSMNYHKRDKNFKAVEPNFDNLMTHNVLLFSPDEAFETLAAFW